MGPGPWSESQALSVIMELSRRINDASTVSGDSRLDVTGNDYQHVEGGGGGGGNGITLRMSVNSMH